MDGAGLPQDSSGRPGLRLVPRPQDPSAAEGHAGLSELLERLGTASDLEATLREVGRQFHVLFGVASKRVHLGDLPGVPERRGPGKRAATPKTGAERRKLLPLRAGGRDIAWLELAEGSAGPGIQGRPHWRLFSTGAALAIRAAWVEEQLWKASLTDYLTELPNQRALWMHLGREVARATRTGKPLSLLVLEIDGFKRFNDALGHLAGDDVLRALAGLLGEIARTRGHAARFGGDEFTLILPGVAREAAARIAQRVRRRARALGGPDGRGISLSIGIASFPEDATTARGLLHAADCAMYEAKAHGGNSVRSAVSKAGRPAASKETG